MITPKSPDWIVLMNPFVRVASHIAGVRKQHRHLSNPEPDKGFTDSEMLLQDPKMIGIVEPSFQWNADGTKVENEFPPLPEKFKLAGTFTINEDVTAKRNPMLEKTSQHELDKLPYKVFATDIVFDGMGWVEVSVQVKRNKETGEWPKVEIDVHSLEGKGVMQRRCMNAYPLLMEGAREAGKLKKSKRPRPSKKGEKRNLKNAKRAAAV